MNRVIIITRTQQSIVYGSESQNITGVISINTMAAYSNEKAALMFDRSLLGSQLLAKSQILKAQITSADKHAAK